MKSAYRDDRSHRDPAIRVEALRRLPIVPGVSVLDYGTATGEVLELLIRDVDERLESPENAPSFFWSEWRKDMLEAARSRLSPIATEINIVNERLFDVVICCGVVHHAAEGADMLVSKLFELTTGVAAFRVPQDAYVATVKPWADTFGFDLVDVVSEVDKVRALSPLFILARKDSESPAAMALESDLVPCDEDKS